MKPSPIFTPEEEARLRTPTTPHEEKRALLERVYPGISKLHELIAFAHATEHLRSNPPEKAVRGSRLLHDLADEDRGWLIAMLSVIRTAAIVATEALNEVDDVCDCGGLEKARDRLAYIRSNAESALSDLDISWSPEQP